MLPVGTPRVKIALITSRLTPEISEFEKQAGERQQHAQQLQEQLQQLRSRIDELRDSSRNQQRELHDAQNEQQALGGRRASLLALQQAALGEDEGCVYLERPAGAKVFESTRAVHVASSFLGERSKCDDGTNARVQAALREGAAERDEKTGLERLTGFDTYWYVWAFQNEGTRILE